MKTPGEYLSQQALEDLQLKALGVAIAKAKESGKFKTPDYFLYQWLKEASLEKQYHNLFWEPSRDEFQMRLKNGSWIDPLRWRLKGKDKKRLDSYYRKFGSNTAFLGSPLNARYYRARIAVIKKLIQQMDKDEPGRVLLRNGVFPDYIDQKGLISEQIKETNIPNKALAFHEIASFNTWFTIHPDKVAGTEQITSSREFPITIKGSREKIERTIKEGMKVNDGDFQFTLQLKQRAAKAKLKLLGV
jgi:hypothetical protein